MPKIMITADEKKALDEYIEFIISNPDPCENCHSIEKSVCCGCPRQSEWDKNKSKYHVKELLNHKPIYKYVDCKVELIQVENRIKALAIQKKSLISVINTTLSNLIISEDKSNC